MQEELQGIVNDFRKYIEQERGRGLKQVRKAKEPKPVVPAVHAAEPATGKRAALAAFYQEYANCLNCPLGRTRKKFVFGEGDPSARLMFIGEGPGFDEDMTGRHFVGKAGQLLTKAIETTIGLKRAEVYIGNIVKCHPMKNPGTPDLRGNDRAPTTEEMNSCLPIITRQLEIIKPDIICLLGRTAAQAILKSNEGIHQLRNKFYTLNYGSKDIQVIATIHPASCLYDPSNKKYLWEDFKKIKNFLAAG